MISSRIPGLKIVHDLDGIKNSGLYSLGHGVEKLIKRGIEFEVRGYGDGRVIKRGVHPDANTLEQLEQDRADCKFFKKYISGNLPQTFHFRAVDQEDQESNFILQKKIEGRHLYEFADEEFRDPGLKENLLSFLTGVERMWQEAGRVPDLCKGPGGLKLLDDVRYSRNIMVDKNSRVWLVDTSANSLVFSKKAKLKYKHVPYILMWSVRSLKRSLGG